MRCIRFTQTQGVPIAYTRGWGWGSALTSPVLGASLTVEFLVSPEPRSESGLLCGRVRTQDSEVPTFCLSQVSL